MYVAVKGGEKAIDNAHRLLAEERRGDAEVPELTIAQIMTQMSLAVDRVMNEGSLHDRTLAALAIKQAQGDLVEAIFLLRAYRTTLPRFGYTVPLETATMSIRRRISATFKDLPGGQILGPTFDYTHRLLDFALLEEGADAGGAAEHDPLGTEAMPRVVELLDHEGLVEPEAPEKEAEIGDLTRESMTLPAERDVCLQQLVRGDEGFLLAMGYSSQRGYGRNHPFAGEIRMGSVTVEFVPEELGFAIEIGEITVTECQMINQFKGNQETPPQFTRGYGLTFGYCERKAMAMALVDRALRSESLGEDVSAPVQDQEFMMYHMDNVAASGFVQHLKLPHYVDFQSELETVRRLRREFHERRNKMDAAE
jgi:alpha-D-ribose 1-methylphosphonate 5-triphosphate synthase subunit PhnI